MTRAWQTIDAVETDEGLLELRRRDDDFLMVIDGRVLMSSMTHRSELLIAHAACRRLTGRQKPRVLIGGLGMGFTLKAALDELPADARVVVAEINERVVTWCQGPLARLTQGAVHDPRVEVAVDDVSRLIGRSAPAQYAAIILDLYEGPHAATQSRDDPFYSARALASTGRALAENGVFAVWSEEVDIAFERRLDAAGFTFERQRPRGGRRHTVYLACKPPGSPHRPHLRRNGR